MGFLAHDRVEVPMRHQPDGRRSQSHDAVIETLQREPVQVDEIAGNVHAHDLATIAVVDGAQHVPFDQHRADIDAIPAFEQHPVGGDIDHAVDAILDDLLLARGHRVAQPVAQEPPGFGVQCCRHALERSSCHLATNAGRVSALDSAARSCNWQRGGT